MNSHSNELSDRYRRQSTIVPEALLRKHPVMIVGVGAIGRQVALQLTVMGVSRLKLIDPDQVEPVNLGAQGFREEDLGKPKVEATADLARDLNSEVTLTTHVRRFHRRDDAAEVVFCCVDDIETRGHIFSAERDQVRFFVDGRMHAESIRIVTVCSGHGLQRYRRTLFRSDEAHRGACTARTTFYAASIAAGIMVAHYTCSLRGFEPPMDLMLNLLADELVVRDAEPVAPGPAAHVPLAPPTHS